MEQPPLESPRTFDQFKASNQERVTKRVGGGVQDFDAIKLLKFAAS